MPRQPAPKKGPGNVYGNNNMNVYNVMAIVRRNMGVALSVIIERRNA